MKWLDEIRFDAQGLVPVVAQDAATGEVLMLAYANADALRATLTTGTAHYWSRSRRELWQKGATSGHFQQVKELRVDCDQDAVLYLVHQTGPACHTGERSCFFRVADAQTLGPASPGGHILSRLEEIVARRDKERPDGSYTTYLFNKGIDKTLKKVGEESAEVIIAAKNGDDAELRAEAADLLFHLLVLFRQRELPLGKVWEELEARFGGPTRVPGSKATDHPHS